MLQGRCICQVSRLLLHYTTSHSRFFNSTPVVCDIKFRLRYNYHYFMPVDGSFKMLVDFISETSCLWITMQMVCWQTAPTSRIWTVENQLPWTRDRWLELLDKKNLRLVYASSWMLHLMCFHQQETVLKLNEEIQFALNTEKQNLLDDKEATQKIIKAKLKPKGDSSKVKLRS